MIIFEIMILETERLILSELTINDAPFFYDLVNDPAWIQFIGDRNIKTRADAENYLNMKIIPSYKKNGFGFYLVSRKEDNTSIGICGLIDREGLEHVDVGYAFLPEFRGIGFAFEATKSVLGFAKNDLQLDPVVAITNEDNIKSYQLLERLGLKFDKIIQLADDPVKCRLYSTI
jgi:RimJ/RimL family protein N-acetyltransferase